MRMAPGVLYPLMTRLERDGLVRATWEEVRSDRSEEDAPGRRRKWYELTPKGRRRLESRIASHRAYLAIIDSFIGGARGEPEVGGGA
jgi:PadR family transcriptional regulator PadR